MKIHFVRHGESLANTLHIISNHDLDHKLTGKGRAQVMRVSAALKGRPIQRIYTSPVLRAVETAQIHSETLGVPFEIVDGLREYDLGELEGRGDDEAWEIHSHYWQNWLQGLKRDQCPPGGETYYDIQRRFVSFVEGLIRQFGGTQAEFLCIAHGGVYTFGLPLVLSNISMAEIDRRGIHHTNILTAELQEGRLVCTTWEDAGS
ncbi:MAG: histidine phosphatase family protein [Chloroflexi bacterium]|nr:histidine phosphatase family protein [Chloroflexota bacterium]